MFDSLVKPILLYNSEIWGDEIPKSLQKEIIKQANENYNDKYLKHVNDSPFEKIHVKFSKMVLGVKKQTSNLATKAEIGRYPLHIERYTLAW